MTPDSCLGLVLRDSKFEGKELLDRSFFKICARRTIIGDGQLLLRVNVSHVDSLSERMRRVRGWKVQITLQSSESVGCFA